MSLENPNTNTPESQEGIKKGTALKSLASLTVGILNRNAKRNKDESLFETIIGRTKDTYKSLEDLERQIDPSGQLSGKIEDKISSGAKWVFQQLKTPEEELE